MSQFRDTRNLYLASLPGFEFPLTYTAWLNADDECKAVLLFVNFFSEIELAWYKTRFSYVDEADAVSQVNVYLMKNVEFIKNDETRFRANYIYTVAANCLRSLTYIHADRDREKFESCNEVVSDSGDIINLYDLAPSTDDSIEVQQAKEAIWNIIDRMGPKARKVINKLINPKDSLACAREGSNLDDCLRDVSVSKKEAARILEDLRNNTELRQNLELIYNS